MKSNHLIKTAAISLVCLCAAHAVDTAHVDPAEHHLQKFLSGARFIKAQSSLYDISGQKTVQEMPQIRVFLGAHDEKMLPTIQDLLTCIVGAADKMATFDGHDLGVAIRSFPFDTVSLTQATAAMLPILFTRNGLSSPEATEVGTKLFKQKGFKKPEPKQQEDEWKKKYIGLEGGRGAVTLEDVKIPFDIILEESCGTPFNEQTPLYEVTFAARNATQRSTLPNLKHFADALKLSRGKPVNVERHKISVDEMKASVGLGYYFKWTPDGSSHVQTITRSIDECEYGQSLPRSTLNLVILTKPESEDMTVDLTMKHTKNEDPIAQAVITIGSKVKDPAAIVAGYKLTHDGTYACKEWMALHQIISVIAARKSYMAEMQQHGQK
jgi:hypothetical protein